MPNRLLLITADDFGIGPETTRGILEAARLGRVTSTVLLVNSPFAEEAVRQWEDADRPVELGWHPCLTLDAPILPPGRVSSLVGKDGRFHGLSRFLRKIALGQIDPVEVEAEFRAQLNRFVELVGFQPANVNAHHHVHVFQVVVNALTEVLAGLPTRPFLRRVVEGRRTLHGIPGARLKRTFLAVWGRRAARQQSIRGFPGNQSLLGVTDPQYVVDPECFSRWLSASNGDLVEFACHPGHADPTLADRDADPLNRRPHELERLLASEFLTAVESAGFLMVTAAEMAQSAKNLYSRMMIDRTKFTRTDQLGTVSPLESN